MALTIEDLSSLSISTTFSAELAVVGAGPAGIVTALEAARHGMKVVLIESGYQAFRSEVQNLSAAAEWDPGRHAPMTMAVRRQIGGTSTFGVVVASHSIRSTLKQDALSDPPRGP